MENFNVLLSGNGIIYLRLKSLSSMGFSIVIIKVARFKC